MPYFSVVIPLYNKENFVAATIKSVLDQTFADFELIIVNDASSDNSLSIAQSFNDGRITIIDHDKNKGLSASRNTGIKNAQAEFVAFIDADDLWQPQFLKKIHELIIHYPEAGLFATKYDELHIGNVVIEHPFNLKTGLLDFFGVNLKQPIYCPSSLCVKKEVFGKIGFYDENINMGEDIDFNVRANLIFPLAYDNQPFVRYLADSENQITHSSLKGKIIIDHDKYERENPNNRELKKYLDFHRYTMAKTYKMAGDAANYNKLAKAIDLKNLNYKQRILLIMPSFILRLIKRTKALLHKKGLNPTSY